MKAFTEKNLGLILAIITALCWAVLAIGLKYALSFSTSENIVALRMVFAFLGTLFYFLFFKPNEILKLKSNFPYWILVAGFLLSFNYFGFMKGVELTGASNSQIMIQLGPLLLALIGVYFFKESFSYKQIIGLIIALCGFAFFYYDQTSAIDISSGNLWLLFAALTWSAYAAIQKQLSKVWNAQLLNLVIYAICTVVLVLNSDFELILSLTPWEWFIMFLLGLNTIISYGCFAEAIKRAPASQVSLIITVNPLGTLALIYLGSLWHLSWVPHEPLTWIGVLGALLVVTGVAWTLTRKKS